MGQEKVMGQERSSGVSALYVNDGLRARGSSGRVGVGDKKRSVHFKYD